MHLVINFVYGISGNTQPIFNFLNIAITIKIYLNNTLDFKNT